MRSIAVDRDGTIRPVEIPEPVASAYQAVIRSEAAAQETLCGWIRAGQLDWWNYIQAQFPVAETAEALTQVRARRVLKALLRL